MKLKSDYSQEESRHFYVPAGQTLSTIVYLRMPLQCYGSEWRGSVIDGEEIVYDTINYSYCYLIIGKISENWNQKLKELTGGQKILITEKELSQCLAEARFYSSQEAVLMSESFYRDHLPNSHRRTLNQYCMGGDLIFLIPDMSSVQKKYGSNHNR